MKLRLRQIILITADAISVNLSFVLAIFIRFEGRAFIDENALEYIYIYLDAFIYITIIKLTVFYAFKMYSSLWKYASVEELVQVVLASLVGTMAAISVFVAFHNAMPRSIYVLTFILDTIFIGGLRFLYRYFRNSSRFLSLFNKDRKRILIIGAGVAGSLLVKEYKQNPNAVGWPVAIIDDNSSKKGLRVNGVKVVGTTAEFSKIVEKFNIEEAIIAIPSADRTTIKRILNLAKDSEIKMRTLPSLYNLADGKVSISKVRDVSIEDLLGREEVRLDMDEINAFIKDKVILVTGGGGSIGSELCRQICRFEPKHVAILDIYENSVYELEIELRKQFPNISLKVIIASVRDINRIDAVFSDLQPQIIFHAAAHKHVPLMEANPKEAIKNNILGTRNLINASIKYEAEKFVMISTDKAVNPTNVMGATKRVAEMMIQSQQSNGNTDFVAVRFGNVLGSNGSVIPLFRKQIEEGGPITLTHQDIIRYFMTIPEAAKLVLQAGAMANGGEIFILDMGDPVRIHDLAKNLILLSGLKPYEDIDIVITGLRPGEKLYEELLINKEQDAKTKHHKIFVEKPVSINKHQIEDFFDIIEPDIEYMDDDEVKKALEKLVPTYKCKKHI